MPRTSFVRITTAFEGLHHWPDAPPPDSYLRSPHRHTFAVTVDLEVFHHDREIEINAAARWLAAFVTTLAVPGTEQPTTQPGPLDLGNQSCEQLATRITDAVLDRYGNRRIRCAVLEDNILGAGITSEPETTTVETLTPPNP